MPGVSASQEFTARREEVPAMIAFVADRGADAGVAELRIAHLRIAVEEIALNICNHAYEGAVGRLGIEVSGDGDRFVVELHDDGPPFDPVAAPKPDVDATLGSRRVGGLGVLMVERLMDEFRYRREGIRNIVTLVVDRKQEEPS